LNISLYLFGNNYTNRHQQTKISTSLQAQHNLIIVPTKLQSVIFT